MIWKRTRTSISTINPRQAELLSSDGALTLAPLAAAASLSTAVPLS